MKHTRSYIRYQREKWILKRLKIYKLFFTRKYDVYYDHTLKEVVTTPGNYLWPIEPNKFNKKDPFDCGHTKCCTCHGHKYYCKVPSHRNAKLEEAARLELEDYNGGDIML